MREARSYLLTGLQPEEVEQARKTHGSNELTRQKKRGFWRHYLSSFGDPIIQILLIALAVNIVFLFRHSDWYESIGIAVAILLATFVSTLSEYGSEAAFEKLQEESSKISCRVRRSGQLVLLPSSELVVGDIVLLQSGEKIPADGRIISGELAVDQSALNGESKEARKHNDGSAQGSAPDLASRLFLFMGSVICEGEGIMIIDQVGDHTFYGKLAIEIQEETLESPLKLRLQKLARTISRMGYTAAVIVAVANLFNNFIIDSGFDKVIILNKLTNVSYVLEALIGAITLGVTVIVMAVPEGLPMMITVVLSANMKKMLKDNVLVRKLVGIETAGSLNILFTDKTGTLTKGKLQVIRFLDGMGRSYETATELKKSPALWHSLLSECSLNTDSQISSENGKKKAIGGNGTDRALLEYALPYLHELKGIDLLFHLPFNSKNKYSISHVSDEGKLTYLIKGAPEAILPKCKDYLDASGIKKPLHSFALQTKMQAMGKKAVRMLAFAQSSSEVDSDGGMESLTLIGIVGIQDEIRKEARSAINQIGSAGIQTVMITGDNPATAAAVAMDTGLFDNTSKKEKAVFTSSELAKMSDEDIKRSLKSMRVVARAIPSDKSRLVRIAQEMNLVAGMTGDGINDAPALKRADVGFAMGSGTEIAKEAGDIIILDNNISSIAKAILYGRTIYKSIRKFLIFQLTMNFCAVSLSVICPFIGVEAPLTVLQMLWVNIIMDTLAGLAFSGELPLNEYMKESPKKKDEEIINRYMYSQILFTGAYTVLLCLLFLKLPFFHDIFHFSDSSDYFMTAFFALFIFAGVFNSFSARTYRLNLLSYIWANPLFIIIMLMVIVVQLFIIYSGGAVFRTTHLQFAHLPLIILLALSVIPADIIRKLGLRSIGRKGHI